MLSPPPGWGQFNPTSPTSRIETHCKSQIMTSFNWKLTLNDQKWLILPHFTVIVYSVKTSKSIKRKLPKTKVPNFKTQNWKQRLNQNSFSFSESKSDLGNEQWSSSSIQPRWFWESQVIFYKKAVFIEVTFANSGSWWCGCDQMGGRREATHIKRFTDNDVQIWRLSRSKVQERKETSDI